MKPLDLFEHEIRGSLDFPIQYYCITPSHPRYRMEPHWHPELELIYVKEGEFALYLNNIEYLLKAGDLVFIEGGCLHRGVPENCNYDCIVLDLSMLRRQQKDAAEKYLQPLASMEMGIDCLLHPSEEALYQLSVSLFETMKKREAFYELKVYSLLFGMLEQLYVQQKLRPSDSTKHRRQTEAVSRLLDWIDENYAEPITLSRLANLSGMSEKYICRIFKEYTSKSPIRYINELRIENACYQIIYEGKSVTEAAYDCGFNELSYFSKVFKEQMGLSPSVYLKKYRSISFLADHKKRHTR